MNAQQQLDHERRTYLIDFPSIMKADEVHAWLRQIASGLHTKSERRATPSILLHVVARDGDIKHYLSVPWKDAEHVVQQLHGHVIGVSATYQEHGLPKQALTYADEFELTEPDVKLDLQEDASSRWRSILNSMNRLGENEAVVLQWCIRPLAYDELPEPRTSVFRLLPQFRFTEQTDKKHIERLEAKNAEPNFAASLRIGAEANTEARAFQLVGNTFKSLAGDRGFVPARRTDPRKIAEVIYHGRTPRYFTDRYAASELTALIGWPLGVGAISGVSRDAARNFPPAQRVLRHNSPEIQQLGGITVGTSTLDGRERSIAIDYESLTMHTYVTGTTGVGKSTVLENIGRQVAEDGHGLIVLDPKGDAYDGIRNNIPPHRIDDVIDIDFTNGTNFVGFNVLDQYNSHNAVDQLVDLLEHIYDDNGVHFRRLMYHGLRTLANVPGSTFNDLSPLILPKTPDEERWAKGVKEAMHEPEFVQFWDEWDKNKRRDEDARSTLNRIWQLTSRPETRYLLGQSTSSFKMLDAVRENKIILINMSPLSKQAQKIIGSIFFESIWESARNARASRPNFLIMDEFQVSANIPFGFDEVLALARSFNLCVVAANQFPEQLTGKLAPLQKAILSNTRNKLILNTEGDSARLWERFLSNGIKDTDISNLDKYVALARILTPSGMSQPFTMRTLAPRAAYNSRDRVADASIRKYTRTAAEIRAEDVARRQSVTRRKISSDPIERTRRKL